MQIFLFFKNLPGEPSDFVGIKVELKEVLVVVRIIIFNGMFIKKKRIGPPQMISCVSLYVSLHIHIFTVIGAENQFFFLQSIFWERLKLMGF